MGYRKIGLLLLLSSTLLFSNSTNNYEDYLKEQKTSFSTYKQSLDSEFKEYKKAYEKAFKEYSNNISKKWSKKDISSKKVWVEYGKDFNTKKKVDFKKKEVTLEVIAKNKKDAKKKLKELSKELLKDNIQSAYKNDQLEQSINRIIKKNKKVKNKDKVIGDILTKKDIENKINNIKVKKVKNSEMFIYKVNIKLPSNTIIKKAMGFKKSVLLNAKDAKIPPSLVYAIMHSESSFNPMARSYVPAFGLMQIVPRTAGIDTYKFLYGKKKLLSSNYLYNSKNNIKIGTNYLHILYYKYLRKIENPISKMYCTIAAYNTGAGNVAKAFIGSYNINKASKKINSMTPNQVYNHLRKHLPHDETKKYLVKVNKRVSVYNKLLKNQI